MDDKIFLNEYRRSTENDLQRTFVILEPISTRRTNAFESFQNEFRPIAYEEFLNYSSQSAAKNCSLPMQDESRETEVSNANSLFTESLKCQSNFQEVQPNTLFEYNESRGVNMEVQGSEQGISVDISTVGECIRTAWDCLLGIYPQNNDLISENFDSQSDHSILSEIHSFEPKADLSIVQSEHFNANGGMNSENKCERVELKNELCNFDSINLGLKFSQSYMHAVTATKENIFLSKAEKPSFEKTYCEKCSKTFTRKSAFLKHKCVNTPEKRFQYGVSQPKDNQSRYKRLNTKEKKIQCDVCEKQFFKTNALVRHRRSHTGEKPFQCNMCEKSFSQLATLNAHMRTHTGEKPFQCNVCEKSFSQLATRNAHMRTHTGEKPFQCPSCRRIFSDRSSLRKHMLIHNRQNTS